MPQKFYEGQEFHNPSDPTAPVLIYRAGKFVPKGVAGPVSLNEADAKTLSGYRDRADQALNEARAAQRFRDLNADNPTGGAMGYPMIGGAVRAVKTASDPAYGEMDQISSMLAPKMRPAGSGSSSDKDTNMYVRGFTNLQVPEETNRKTANQYHHESDYRAAKAAWFDKWAQVRGNLLGADTAFNQYWSQKTRNGFPYDAAESRNAALKAKSADRGPRLLGIEH